MPASPLTLFSVFRIPTPSARTLHSGWGTCFEFVVLRLDSRNEVGVMTRPIHFLFELHIELFGVFLIFGGKDVYFAFGFEELVLQPIYLSFELQVLLKQLLPFLGDFVSPRQQPRYIFYFRIVQVVSHRCELAFLKVLHI